MREKPFYSYLHIKSKTPLGVGTKTDDDERIVSGAVGRDAGGRAASSGGAAAVGRGRRRLSVRPDRRPTRHRRSLRRQRRRRLPVARQRRRRMMPVARMVTVAVAVVAVRVAVRPSQRLAIAVTDGRRRRHRSRPMHRRSRCSLKLNRTIVSPSRAKFSTLDQSNCKSINHCTRRRTDERMTKNEQQRLVDYLRRRCRRRLP